MSSCTARFPPNLSWLKQATTLKHIHFSGISNYEIGSHIQSKIVEENIKLKIANKNPRLISGLYPALLTFEFDSVYTGGKREKDIKKATKIPSYIDIPLVQTDRGGQVTYHGPGQLVAYFIWDLGLWKNLTSRCFVNFVEKCSVETIKNLDVKGVCTTENTGVWVSKLDDISQEKISSIGINIKRYVTSHGVSINLSPDLKYLNNPDFIMCGLKGYKQTSICKELGYTPCTVETLGELFCESVVDRMNNYMMNNSEITPVKMKVDKLTVNCDESSISPIKEFLKE